MPVWAAQPDFATYCEIAGYVSAWIPDMHECDREPALCAKRQHELRDLLKKLDEHRGTGSPRE